MNNKDSNIIILFRNIARTTSSTFRTCLIVRSTILLSFTIVISRTCLYLHTWRVSYTA